MARTYRYCLAQSDIRDHYLYYMQQESFPTSLMTNAQINKWIDTACDYMDSKLAGRYDVPITESPPCPILRDIASLLTTYYVLRNIYTGQAPDTTEWVSAFKTEAYQKLSQLIGYNVETGAARERQKIMPLLASGGDPISRIAQHGALSSTGDYKPTFGVKDLQDAEVDPDRERAEE